MNCTKFKWTLGIAAAALLTAGNSSIALAGDTNSTSNLPVGEVSEQEKTFAAEIMKATKDDDYQAFIADGNKAFKKIKKTEFENVCDQVTSRLKTGYRLVFLGGLKEGGDHITIWKIAYDDQGDDDLMKLAVRNGKISGALLTNPF